MQKPISFICVMMSIFIHLKSLRSKNEVVTASDFVYSFDRIKDKKIASPGLWTLESVKHYEAVDDYTLKIELTHPFSPFLGIQYEVPQCCQKNLMTCQTIPSVPNP